MAAVTVTFSFTEEEAKALARRALYRSRRLRLIGALAMVAMVGIGVLALAAGATLIGVVWLALAAVYAALLVVFPYLAVERRGVRAAEATHPRTYSFDDDAISTRVGDATAVIPWGAVHRVSVGRRFWLVEVGARRQRLVIPARAFASDADAAAVRELVRRKVHEGPRRAATAP